MTWRRRAVYVMCGLLVLVAVLALAAALALRSDWFREQVRARIVREVEKASGGRVEIGSFHFDWSALRAEVRAFVLHGSEPPQEAPLFRADSIRVDLKVLSMLRRDIDLAALVVEKPEIRIRVSADGRTNIPSIAELRAGRNWVEQVLGLEIRRFELRDGFLEYDSRSLPFQARGERLRAQFVHEPGRYRGTVSMRQLRLEAGSFLPMSFDTDLSLALERDRLVISGARLTTADSSVEASGTMTDWKSPRTELNFRLAGSFAELGRSLRLPLSHRGRVTLAGKITSGGGNFELTAKATGSGLALASGPVNIDGIGFESDLRLSSGKLELRGLTSSALGGVFRGQADIEDFRRYRVEGSFSDFSLEHLARVEGVRRVGWNATASGEVRIAGGLRGKELEDQRVEATIAVDPAAGDRPLSGSINLVWDRRLKSLELGTSHLATPLSRVNFNGTLGDNLRVGLQSRDLNDVLPALALLSDSPPDALPVVLRNGVVRFDGVVRGPLDQPRIGGALSLENFEYAGQLVNRASARVEVSSALARAEGIVLEQAPLRLEGAGEVALVAWRIADTSVLKGAFSMRGASLEKLLAGQRIDVPVTGTLSGQFEVAGTPASPQASGRFQIDRAVLDGQPFERVDAALRYTGKAVEVSSFQAQLGMAHISGRGSYEHPPGDLRSGSARFEANGSGIEVSSVRRLAGLRAGLGGKLDARARGAGRVDKATFLLTELAAEASIQNLVQGKRSIGSLTLKAETKADLLTASATASVRGAAIRAGGSWRMNVGYPGKGDVHVSRLSFAAMRELLQPDSEADDLPFVGFIDGEADFSGPLFDPKKMRAAVRISTLELTPKPAPETAKTTSDLSLRNDGPLLAEIDDKGAHVRQARFVAKDTSIEASGTFSFQSKSPWDFALKGAVNLAVLGTFNRDLVSRGVSSVDATIRGTLEQPQVTGRMELKDASFYLVDVPNGLDKVNGEVLFDRTRATLEKLTAQTGGGELNLSGFVGFGGELTYRLQATADAVRVRYPEGVSTSANAQLSFTGTASRSLLAGTVTILRSGFTPRTDVGGLLARSTAAPPPAVTNEFLRNMQLDIRVETAQNAQFSTSLTRDVQAEVDLRLRGGPSRPVLLGRISVTEGEINFFGSKYTINRGEINFFNPLKLEPVIDLDLETRVRGVIVTINFAGPVSKLAMSYRSDPPLRSDEILALLAVGRAPTSTSTLGGGQSVQSPGMLASGANTLLGQALAAPVSSQLQRFFGVSRLKIDPQLTGTENTPQARLTIEQQVSRDVTITFVTSLNRTQQQLVRLEWNLSRQWSVLAVRDENGFFGMDFLYRKRFR